MIRSSELGTDGLELWTGAEDCGCGTAAVSPHVLPATLLLAAEAWGLEGMWAVSCLGWCVNTGGDRFQGDIGYVAVIVSPAGMWHACVAATPAVLTRGSCPALCGRCLQSPIAVGGYPVGGAWAWV